ITHHVAAIREVDRQYRPAAVADTRGAVTMDQRIAEGLKVASGEAVLQEAAELGVDREEILEGSMLGTRFPHADLSVLLVERGADLAVVPGLQLGELTHTGNDLSSRLHNAARSERVRFPRVAERRS